MAHPKRKISKTRRDKRRTHYKLGNRQLHTDATTGETHLYHRLNLETGVYKGVQVLEPKDGE
jgi:large subunit ribosomal protein L32